MLLQEHSSSLCHDENGKLFCLDELWPALIIQIHWDFTINAVHAFQNTKKLYLLSHMHLWSSFPLHGRTNISLVNYESCWQHQMSVRELRHDRVSGQFSKSRVCLQAFPSFLPHPYLLFYLHQFSRSLTLVPHSLLLNCTETLPRQANEIFTK